MSNDELECADEDYGDRDPYDWRGLCRTRYPEPHLMGEFPLSCRACHEEADS